MVLAVRTPRQRVRRNYRRHQRLLSLSWLDQEGRIMTKAPLKKPLSEGWWAEVVPLTFGRARITITDGFAVSNAY